MNTPMRNFSLSVISIIGAVGFLAVSFAEDITPVQSPLRILVANDDGIDSQGLHALALALSEIGEVVVSCRLRDRPRVIHRAQSGSGRRYAMDQCKQASWFANARLEHARNRLSCDVDRQGVTSHLAGRTPYSVVLP